MVWQELHLSSKSTNNRNIRNIHIATYDIATKSMAIFRRNTWKTNSKLEIPLCCGEIRYNIIPNIGMGRNSSSHFFILPCREKIVPLQSCLKTKKEARERNNSKRPNRTLRGGQSERKTAEMGQYNAVQPGKWLKWAITTPISFGNGQNECRKAQLILKMAKMSVASVFQFWNTFARVSTGCFKIKTRLRECRLAVLNLKQGFAGLQWYVLKPLPAT